MTEGEQKYSIKTVFCRYNRKKQKNLKKLKIVIDKIISMVYHITVLERKHNIRNARVAQLVERDLAKVEAAGSSPVSRSYYFGGNRDKKRVSAIFFS